MYYKKQFYFNPHAVEEFAKDNIPEKDIKYMFKIGVIIDDLSKGNTKRKLCICKYKGEFWTTVFEPREHYIVIITGYESKKWEIDAFKGNKREKHA